MKKILYLLAAWMLASIPLVNLHARAGHGDWYFREERGGTQYSAYSAGNGKVHFKILVFASGKERNFWAYANENNIIQGSRCWTHLEGAADTDYPNFLIYEADNNGHNKPVGDGGNNPNDRGWVKLKVLSEAIIVTNTYDGEPVRVGPDGQWHEFWLKRQGTEDWLTYLEFDYIEPASYAKKSYWVGNSVHFCKNGGEGKQSQTRTLAKLTGGDPDQAPQLYNPFLYVLNESGTTGFGKIAIPYVSVQKPYSYKINGATDSIFCDKSCDMFYVNSDDVVKSFYVTMRVQRSMDSTQTHELNSNTINVPAYHKIHDFAVGGTKTKDEGSGKWYIDYRKKQLTWKIYHPSEEDIMPNDMFEIQRAYTADYSDAMTIDIIPLKEDTLTTDTLTDQQTYTYLDTVEAAWWNPVEKSYRIYYRVRRVSSAQWGWTEHNYADSASFAAPHLYTPLTFSSATYRKADDFETSHRVDFSIYLPNKNYNPARTEEQPGCSSYYIDPKQRFMLRKILTELNDTIDIEIPRDSVQKAMDAITYNPVDSIYYKSNPLVHFSDIASSPCVHYLYKVYVDTTDVTVHTESIYYGTKSANPERKEDKNVYYTEAANLNTFSASQLEYSDGVLLRWEAIDGNVGTYKIETRPAGKDTAWTVLVEDYEGSWFKDISANPFISREWEYHLTMTYECNGNVKSVDTTAVGSRNPYGKISGYVRYEDGTACPGIPVTASRISNGETVQMVETDEDGYFLLDSILYGEGYAYSIQPTSMSAEFRYNNTSSRTATITLGLNNSIRENVNFANISSVRCTGRVLYENSTVPARDVTFLLNGIPVKSGTSLYKTDASGNFEFRVPERTPFTIQAVKEGHTFAGDGFVRVLNEKTGLQDSLISRETPLDGVRIFDQTKVRLIGRLAGGRIQAEKPLGFGLSENNLGDDLKMVFELEGDNISQIVHYKDDLMRDSVLVNLRHDVITQDGSDSVGITRTEYYKKRIIIYPDVNTGEYYVDLFPVKYKITQATARGYATLYADGKTGETLDLTNAPLRHYVNTYEDKELYYNETYNITYHSPIIVSYTQMQYGMPLDYYGIKDWKTQALNGEEVNVELVTKDPTGQNKYLFGAPVFPVGNYQFQVSAHENYYYNNEHTRIPDIVYLTGGNLKVYNGMRKATEIFTMPLDSKGSALINATIDHVTFVQTGDSALHSLDFSVESEGAYINAESLRAYVLGAEEKAQDILEVDATPTGITLLDILRDPPGSGSFATLEAGTQYHVSYKEYFNYRFGVNFKFSWGNNTQYFVGSYAGTPVGGTELGIINVVQKTSDFTLPISMQYIGSGKADYDFTTASTISTGNDPLSVGTMADVYIGVTNGVMTGKADAFRIVDSISYGLLKGQIDNQNVRVVQQGTDTDGNPWYLMRTEDVLFKKTILSSFSYTQEHILNSVIPELYYHLRSLLLTGSRADAVALAESTQQPVYWSRVSPDDERFGVDPYYDIIKPEGYKLPVIDQISADYKAIQNWIGVVATNEAEKVKTMSWTVATEPPANPFNIKELEEYMAHLPSENPLIQTISLSSGVTQTYSESYSYSNFRSAYIGYPFMLQSGAAQREGMGGFGVAFLKDKLFPSVWSQIDDYLTTAEATQAAGGNGNQSIKAEIGTAKFGFDFEPIMDFNMTLPENEETIGSSKTTNYTISLGAREHLTFNVYKSKTDDFNKQSKSTRYTAHDLESDNVNEYLFGSLMYETLGGASECPWEGADSTLFYHPGTPLNAATQKIENPQITINRHEMSNVPHDQPAVFTITMWNEADETSGLASAPSTTFTLKQDELTNAKGVKISIDGTPLGNGREFQFRGNTPIVKTLEVRAGEAYDYEDICLVLASTCMPRSVNQKACLSVHYMPVACPVVISAPHDNWIMNTLSPQDSTGWYLPVVIDGFDVNYKNFDHIEFQYKLATQSDDGWVNLCSYYADDSLYNVASGNKAMITSGRIEDIHFYGERDPMEQQYDLRAVAFCRHGNGFITRASAVIRGTKDTRVPRVFGEPEPANSILGVGDNLKLRFNEAIAGNYLDEDNNFQLVGFTNSSGITSGISLLFPGTEDSYAESKVVHSISDKSFTIDMMVRPQDPDAEYTFFNYDTKGRRPFSFGKSADNRLFAKLGDGAIYSDTLPEKMLAFTRVAVVYDREKEVIRFYAGTQEVTDTLIAPFDSDTEYYGSAPITIGKGFAGNMKEVRLWSKALSPDEISQTFMTRMTGYERELVAYYPMDEGKGTTLADKANGANLYTTQCSWEYQEGISLRVKEGQIVTMADEFLSRSDKQDETLMFWFRTPSKNGTIFSAGRMNDSIGTEIAFKNGTMVFKNYANEWKIDGDYADNEWHHFALTVSRNFNNVAVYLDDKQKLSFAATKMGEVSGEMYIGGNKFEGNIDEFIIFEQALPQTLMETFGTISPMGDEMGLMAYLPFSEMKENENGILEQVFSVNDQRVFKTSEGDVVEKVQPLILSVSDSSAVKDLGDRSLSAPVQDIGQLTKMNFDWSFNNDELMINLKMRDREINKQTIYITVRDVEDLNGNPMVSPVMWTSFVDRNALKWGQRTLTAYSVVGNTDVETIQRSIRIINNSGKRHQYSVESLPDWATMDVNYGSIEPMDELTLTLNFNATMAAGEYSDIIYLTDENGLSEPLRLELTIEALPPYGEPDRTKYPYNMSICAQVVINDSEETNYDTDNRDLVYAFCCNELVGVGSISFNEASSSSNVYLTVSGNEDMTQKPVRFQLWRASTGNLYDLTPSSNVLFAHGYVYNCGVSDPLVLTTSGSEMQTIVLNRGWNWISTYLDLSTTKGVINTCLSANESWAEGDEIKNPANCLFSKYSPKQDLFIGSLDNIHHSNIYMAYSQNGNTMRISGEPLEADSMVIQLRGSGQWNSFPCLYEQTVSLSEALADYYDKASVGDIIKARNRFAYFSQNKRWEGNLSAIRPGEGYLLRRMAQGMATVHFYPPVPSNAKAKANAKANANAEAFTNTNAATNMTMIAMLMTNTQSPTAKLSDSEALQHAVIKVYIDNELAGVAEPIANAEANANALYYLTIQSDQAGKPLRFETEDGTPLIVAGEPSSAIHYLPDAHEGTPQAPVRLIPLTDDQVGATKIIENDHVIIIRNGERYDVTGKKL